MNFWIGIALALASSCSFGLIPLFAVPMLGSGLPPQMVAFYRFGFAALLLFPLILHKHYTLRLPPGKLLTLAMLALAYFLDVQLFFYAFQYLASGVVATLEFVAPVIVMGIMVFGFHQKFHWQGAFACVLAIVGVWLLSGDSAGTAVSLELEDTSAVYTGVTLALLSALCCALYMVGCEVGGIGGLPPLLVTFYLMFFGSFYCAAVAIWSDVFALPGNWANLALALMLALVTAVLSNLTLVMAIQRVGSVLTSIMGVMEPLTAVCIGVLVFNEAMTFCMGLGALLVTSATLLATLGRK